jgi:hypothetical protein
MITARVIGKAENIETRLVGFAGVLEQFAHLVDARLQPEAEEDVASGGRVGDGVHEVLLRGSRGEVVERSE